MLLPFPATLDEELRAFGPEDDADDCDDDDSDFESRNWQQWEDDRTEQPYNGEDF